MNIQASLKQIVRSRTALFQIAAIFVLMFLILVVVAVYVRPSEVQVENRYSGYGVSSFYRDQWWQLLAFPVFAILSAVTHFLIYVKLNDRRGMQFAHGFGWLSIAMFSIWLVTIYALLKVVTQ